MAALETLAIWVIWRRISASSCTQNPGTLKTRRPGCDWDTLYTESLLHAITSLSHSRLASRSLPARCVAGVRARPLPEHALPVAIFGEEITYAALGHLHLAQSVGGQDRIRYSGSPIPLALDERHYPHQVVQVDLEGGRLLGYEALAVPRAVDILRLPETGAAEPTEIEALIGAQTFDPDRLPECQPYLEVAVQLKRPDPALRQRVEDLLADLPVRLLKLTTSYEGRSSGLSAAQGQRLEELKPDRVFRERYRQQFGEDPSAELIAAFHELVEQVQEADS